jgi:hypothetical protein
MEEENICPVCGEDQISPTDKTYLKLYPHCWSCDRDLWAENKLSTDEFEARELEALNQSMQ